MYLLCKSQRFLYRFEDNWLYFSREMGMYWVALSFRSLQFSKWHCLHYAYVFHRFSYCNIDTVTLLNCNFGKITRLNTSPFLSKSTINYFQIGTKNVVTYIVIVDMCNRALWKNKNFICFTMCLKKSLVIYVRGVYIVPRIHPTPTPSVKDTKMLVTSLNIIQAFPHFIQLLLRHSPLITTRGYVS